MAAAVRREVDEETGVEIDQLHYIGTWRVNDWRYQGREDAVMTTFFVAEYIFGAPRAGDDVDSLEWVPIRRLRDAVEPQHKMLAIRLEKYVSTEQKARQRKAENLKGGKNEHRNTVQDSVGA